MSFSSVSLCAIMERKGAMHLQYGEVRQAHFLERPNRFIAHVELEGETVVCHVI